MGDLRGLTLLSFKEYISNLEGKRIAVIGAGISNTPLIGALLDAGIDTTIRDVQTRKDMGGAAERFEKLGAKLNLGADYLENLDADVIFRTPGLMPANPSLTEAVARGAVLTSEMEVFFDVCPCRIIGVTGSDGKTTTTSLIAEMLRREGLTVHIGGNIGAPLLHKADDMQYDDIVVLELSSFQLITMNKCPDIAVVTNLSPNHLDVHGDMAEYIEAKRSIFIRQRKTDRAVFNFDNEYTREFASAAPGEVLLFSRNCSVRNGVYCDGETIFDAIDGPGEPIIKAGDVYLPGAHNIENFMAACAAVRGLAKHRAMQDTAREFRGVPHRIELVRELRGVRYYNDSIASSPTRTIAGLRSFDKKVILIAGGKDKGVAFDGLGAEIVSRVKTLILTGMTAEMIRGAVLNSPGYDGTPEILTRGDFTLAVQTAADIAREGDVVLLSPACTSFDRFKNFEERGELFREIVKGLI